MPGTRLADCDIPTSELNTSSLGWCAGTKKTSVDLLLGLEIDLKKARSAVETVLGRGEQEVDGELQPTQGLATVIDLSLAEAEESKIAEVAPQHLFLAFFREREDIATEFLGSYGLSLNRLRERLHRQLDGG